MAKFSINGTVKGIESYPTLRHQQSRVTSGFLETDNSYQSLVELLLPLATKLGQGNIFRSLCQEFCSQGYVGV